MAEFTCPRCGYTTSHLGNLHSHFERKKPCKPKVSDIKFSDLYKVFYAEKKGNNSSVSNTYKNTSTTYIINENNEKVFECSICKKTYKHRQSLYNHQKSAHFEEMSSKQEIKQLKKQVKELMKCKEANLKSAAEADSKPAAELLKSLKPLKPHKLPKQSTIIR